MADATCSVDGCEKPVKGRGWCAPHYMRWYQKGDPLAPGVPDWRERLWSKVEKTDTCWLWRGRLSKGYGRIQIDKRVFYTHRLAYEQLVGSIPDGLQLDHLCRNTACCNPAHLEPVTIAENVRRGKNGVLKVLVTHCKRGHPYDEANTYLWKGRHRMCRACAAGRERERKRRIRLELLEESP